MADDQDTPAQERSEFDEALKRFKFSKDAFDPQRKREAADLLFQTGEGQWDDASRRLRDAAVVDGVMVPARPVLSISKLDQPIQLVLNQQKAAHLGVDIHPVSEDADPDTAKALQGLYRAIERDSRAQMARGWAFDRAVKAGMGFYRVNTVYDEQAENKFDQKIVIERLLYQDAVYLDPAAIQPDWSDGEFAFVCTWMPLDKYKREYPDSELAGYDAGELAALMETTPDWVQTTGADANAVLVAEYFRVSYTDDAWVAMPDGSCQCESEMDPEQLASMADAPRRAFRKPTVEWSILNGVEELEPPQEWNGRYIPIIPVIGRELQPMGGERTFTGMIGPAKDGQKLFNYAASNLVEVSAMEPRAPWLMYEGQDEGYESQWGQSNTRNFPVLKIKPTTIGGQPAPPPQRVPIDANRLTVSMQLMGQADQFIQSTTAVFDPGLGRMNGDRSGKAVLALQQQGDSANSHYLSNLADVAMTYEAKVILDLIPKVYDRPGRVVQILDGEGDSAMAMLNQPFVVNPTTQRPMPAPQGPMAIPMPQTGPGPFGPPPQMPQGMPPQGAPQPAKPPVVKHYNLNTGTYGVSVTVGRSYQTRLEEGSAEIGQILQASPGLMPILGPLYFKFRDFPGAQEIADLLKRMRDKQYPGLDASEDDAQAAVSKAQALEQQVQQMQGQLQQAAEVIKGEQVKHGADVEREKMKLQASMEIEHQKAELQIELQRMKNATTIEVAKINAMVKGAMQAGAAENELIALHEQQSHEMGMTAQQHQQMLAQQEAAAAQAQTEAGPDEAEPGYGAGV